MVLACILKSQMKIDKYHAMINNPPMRIGNKILGQSGRDKTA